MSLALTNANLIDAVNPQITPDATVIIEDGRIVEIGAGPLASSGGRGQVVDLRGAFLLPGLWDVHIHPEYPVPPGTTPAQETANFGRALSLALTEAGVTGVRCGGRGAFHGRGVAAGFRRRRRAGAAGVCLGLLSYHHGRALPHLRAGAGMRRALRVRPGHPRANQERR